MFALCDVNAFYASCETVFRPDLWGKPVVVLSNNDGCVIARNAEAKALGVKMGDPWFKQKDLFRRCGVVCFSSNYELYADMSNRVMSTLEELSPRVEIYSIDEAFCDLTGVRNCRDLTDFGREIRATVLQRTHLTVGVGIAQTKTLAKLANHAAKKWQRQTGGVVDLSNLERQRKLMSALPVDDVWGIGRRISKKLDAMGIKTVLDLADTDIRFIRKHFTEKLRGERQYCRQVTTFVRTSPFAVKEPCYSNAAVEKLPLPTQDSRDIIAAACRALNHVWREGYRYMKAG
ncbi:TPA: translesion error-prone DNA polymerase V subunit UmuC, partial [Escherichia coli]|nr:translesion error-prone DNA polymerase V subunit UmuC [Escherichia coli]